MKLNKKKVFTLALAVCLIAILSLGSLAWFTDNDSVTNDFYIAGSEDQDPDKVFSVDVWENDEDGNRHDDGIEYPEILPGDDLYKEVNVENTGSYEQYIRATVVVTDAHIWQDLYGQIFVPLDLIATDLNPNFETFRIEYNAELDSLTYVLHYNAKLQPSEIVNVFTNVHIPEELDRFQAAEMAGGFQIGVVADAVQTENVGNNAVEAFATVGMGVEEGVEFVGVSPEATVYLDLSDKTLPANIVNEGALDVVGGTIEYDGRGFSNSGTATLNGVTMITGNAGNYGNVTTGEGASTTYTDVNIQSAGGGIGVENGAEVVFNSGSMDVSSSSTSGRYLFYVVGEGSELTINDGEFSFATEAGWNQKRAYVYAGEGATVYITGGTFGVASNRKGYDGIMGEGTVIVTGGTFGFDPTEWVAEGYQVVKTGSQYIVLQGDSLITDPAALADAVANGGNVALGAGSYTMPSTTGDVTISGTKDTVISANKCTADNVTFNGVTIQSTGKAYVGIQHSNKVVYNDCTIVGKLYLYADTVEFNNCTFDLSATNDYTWVYGANNVTFSNCTFNTMGKAILVFQDGSKDDQTVTVENCTFNASAPAYTSAGLHVAAVSMDGSQGGTYNVILNNNTVDGNFNGLWQDKTGAGNITVTVDGNVELSAN